METESKPWAGWRRQNSMPLFGNVEEVGKISKILLGHSRLADQIVGFGTTKRKTIMFFYILRNYISLALA